MGPVKQMLCMCVYTYKYIQTYIYSHSISLFKSHFSTKTPPDTLSLMERGNHGRHVKLF